MHKIYLIAAVLLLWIEIGITLFFESGFIRHTFGDFLVVILLYCCFRGLLTVPRTPIALITLAIAYGIEFLQLTDFLYYLGIRHYRWANLIFGNSFSVQDLIAYTLGIGLVVLLDRGRLEERRCKTQDRRRKTKDVRRKTQDRRRKTLDGRR